MRKKDASWLPIHDHFLPGLTLHARYAHLALSTLAAQILAAQMKKKMQLKHASKHGCFFVAKDQAGKEWRKGGDHVCAGGATRWRSG